MTAERVVCTAQDVDQESCTELAEVMIMIDYEAVPACEAHEAHWAGRLTKDGDVREVLPLS